MSTTTDHPNYNHNYQPKKTSAEQDPITLSGDSSSRNLRESYLQEHIDPEKATTNTNDNGDNDTIDNSRPKVFKNLAHEITCILIFTFAVACTSISTGAFQISLDQLSSDFNVSGGRLTWSVGSISLANGSFLLLSGSISDVVGRKNCIIFGFVAFAISALIGGFMKSFIDVCIFRAIMGLSLAFAVPASGGLLSSFYPVSLRKNRAMACFSAGAPLGMVAGLIIGGVCAEVLNWRCIHYFLAIVYGIIAILAVILVPADVKVNKQFFQRELLYRLAKVDYGGGFLIATSLTLIVFALNQSGVPKDGWKTDYIIATLVVGIVLLIAFIVYENYIPKRPLMPMFIWRSTNFSLAMATMSCCWMSFLGVLTYFSILYFEQVLNYSPLHTTACILPMGIFGMMVNAIAAMILHIVPGRIIMTFACGSFLAAALLWATMSQHQNYWRAAFEALCFAVLGADLSFNVVNMVTVNSVNDELQGTAQGVFQTITQLSAAVGLALSNTIVQQKYPPFGGEVDLSNKQEVKQLFHSFKYAYYFAIGCSSAAIVLSAFIKVGTAGSREAAKEKANYDLKNKENYEKGRVEGN